MPKAEASIKWLSSIPEADLILLMEKYRVSYQFVKDRADDILDYCEAHGRKYKNYKAALRNFIKSHLEKHPEFRIKKEIKHEPEEQVGARTPEEQQRIQEKLDAVRRDLRLKVRM